MKSPRFCYALLVCACAILSACNKNDNQPTGGSSQASNTEKPKIALVMKSLANEFFSTMEQGAKKHQEAHSADYELLANGIKNETDLAQQVSLVEQMIARGVNAIVIAPADSKALITVLKHAKAA